MYSLPTVSRVLYSPVSFKDQDLPEQKQQWVGEKYPSIELKQNSLKERKVMFPQA